MKYRGEILMEKEYIEIKDFCPFCKKQTKINIDLDSLKNEITTIPYCTKCKNKLPEILTKHKRDIDDMIEFFHGVSDYKVTKEKEYVFSPNKPIYDFEVFGGFVYIFFTFFFIILSFIIYKGTKILSFSLIWCSPIIYLIVYAFIEKLKIKKYREWFNYVKENGKKFSGRVKRVIEKEKSTYDSRSEREIYFTEYYLEVEYFDIQKNENVTFVTPKLRKPPCKNNIICDVYVVNKLPEKFEKSRKFTKKIADNFI